MIFAASAIASPAAPPKSPPTSVELARSSCVDRDDDGFCRSYRDPRYRQVPRARREKNYGRPYNACFMNCINSGHPLDFCKNVANLHFCF